MQRSAAATSASRSASACSRRWRQGGRSPCGCHGQPPGGPVGRRFIGPRGRPKRGSKRRGPAAPPPPSRLRQRPPAAGRRPRRSCPCRSRTRCAVRAEPGRRWAFGFAGHKQPQLALVIVGRRHKLCGQPVGASGLRRHWRAGCGCGEGSRRRSAHWPPTADRASDPAARQHPVGCAASRSHAASRSGASARRACTTTQRVPPGALPGTPRHRHLRSAPPQAPALRLRPPCHSDRRPRLHPRHPCASRRDGPGGHIDRARRRARLRGRCNQRCGSACARTGFGLARRARRNRRRRDRRCIAPSVRRRQ